MDQLIVAVAYAASEILRAFGPQLAAGAGVALALALAGLRPARDGGDRRA